MKGCIVALPPTCNFPGGGAVYTFNAACVLGAPIYAPSGLVMQFTDLFVNQIDDPVGDYSLITTIGPDIPDNLPRPIIAVVHDGHTFYELGGKGWAHKMDGFVVDVFETIPMIRSVVPDAKIIQMPLPYIHPQVSEVSIEKRRDVVVSLGRIVPEKGHRLVANLVNVGYEVWIIGQKVEHEEYGLYYKKIEHLGATIYPTPTEDEKRKLLLQAKIFVSFPFTYEIAEPVEYSALEAMSCGLFPVTAVWTEEYYSRAGLLAFHAE